MFKLTRSNENLFQGIAGDAFELFFDAYIASSTKITIDINYGQIFKVLDSQLTKLGDFKTKLKLHDSSSTSWASEGSLLKNTKYFEKY